LATVEAKAVWENEHDSKFTLHLFHARLPGLGRISSCFFRKYENIQGAGPIEAPTTRATESEPRFPCGRLRCVPPFLRAPIQRTRRAVQVYHSSLSYSAIEGEAV